MGDERDLELDELEKELRQPYIEGPEELDEGQGQTCFINEHRMCMADCTAFNIYAEVKQGPERCTILVYLANSAVHSQELVQLSKKLASGFKTQAADKARQQMASQPIPDPFGGQG